MACYTTEMNEYGDRPLLESMLFPLFNHASHENPKTLDQLLSSTTQNDEDDELSLDKMLSSPGVDFLEEIDEVDTDGGYDSNDNTEPIQFLYRRSDVHIPAKPAEEQISAEPSTTLTEVRPSDKRLHFVEADSLYRKFMEEIMLIKCCSKQIFQLLEETEASFNRYIEVKHEPGLDRLHVVEAWIWTLKEAVIHSYSATSKDRKRRKFLENFLGETVGVAESSYKLLGADIKSLSRTYRKVEHELKFLIKKSIRTFANNVEGARYYELKSSGYDFFFHQLEESSQSSLAKTGSQAGKQESRNRPTKPTPEQSLQVRCSVDGITIRSGKPCSAWHKFKSVDQDKDKQAFIKIFASELIKPCSDARRDIALVHELLELTSKSKSSKDSIFQSISSCKKMLDKSRSELNFLPKEEMILLYSLNSTRAALELIKPLLTDFIISSERMCGMMDEFHKQRKLLRKDAQIGRIPLQRHSKFEIDVGDVKVNVDLILNRYPNLYNAKLLRDKIIQKLFDGNSIFDELFLEEPQIEMLYKCPSQIYFSPSTQEMMSMLRKLIREQKTISTDPNPAYFLFVDLNEEYDEMVSTLTETRQITPEVLILCSDPIRRFYHTTQEMTTSKEKVLNHLLFASESLLYADASGSNIKSASQAPSSHWIHQIICKALRVWDFHSLPRHLQRHFHAVVESSTRWSERLGDIFSEFSKNLKEFQGEFLQYYDNVEGIHSFATWIQKKFHFDPPEQIISKWMQEMQERMQVDPTGPSKKERAFNLSSLQLNFYMFDMDLLGVNPDGEQRVLLSLSTCSHTVQVGLFAVLFNYLDHIVSRAIVNLNSASATFQKSISMKGIKNALSLTRKLSSSLPYFHQLEDMVMALTFERLHRDVTEMLTYIGLVEGAISQFRQMFQLIQLHMEDRGIVDVPSHGRPPSRKKKKLAKKELGNEMMMMEHHNNSHDILLDLLRASIEVMPNTFEISEDSLLRHSLLQWVNLAEQDSRLKETVKLQLLDLLEKRHEQEGAAVGVNEDCNSNNGLCNNPTIVTSSMYE